MSDAPERTILHDMVNKLTIAQGKVKRVASGKTTDQEIDLEKAQKAIDDTVSLVKQLRELIVARES